MEQVQFQHTAATILCCLCGVPMIASELNMCTDCLKSKINIAEGIETTCIIQFCSKCQRYQKPPWVSCKPESVELLHLLLKKVKGLNKVKIIDANFIWTEPHSKRLKIKATIQKDVLTNTTLQQSVVIEFIIHGLQCPDCTRNETPHIWKAKVQVRQRVDHKRTLLFLEQVLLKHRAHRKTIKITEADYGIDFDFATRTEAQKFVDFLHQIYSIQVKTSKQLISHDVHTSTYNYKFSFSVEIIPLCKDDLVILDTPLAGGAGPVFKVQKISKQIHLLDIATLKAIELPSERYWKNPFRSYANKKQLTPFLVLNTEQRGDGLVDVELAREDEVGISSMVIPTNLNFLYPGDTVMGYDFQNLQIQYFPDVVLVKKLHPPKKRVWKVQRMEIERINKKEDADKEEFFQELEEDPEMRAQVTLFRDLTVSTPNPEETLIPMNELVDEMEHMKIQEQLDQQEQAQEQQNKQQEENKVENQQQVQEESNAMEIE